MKKKEKKLNRQLPTSQVNILDSKKRKKKKVYKGCIATNIFA